LTDAYVLPRAALAVGGGCLLLGWGLVGSGPGLGRVGRPALAVVAAALLAAVFSVSPLLSLAGSYFRYESLVTRLAYVALFAGTALLARTPQARRWTLTAFVGGCLVASLEALHEAATGYPSRPDGNLGQPNLLGALLAMAIPIVCSRVLRAPPWILALPPLVAALVVSSSRSGWLGAIAGTVLLLPLLARPGRARVWLLGAAVLAPLLVLAAIAFSPLAALNGDTGAARLHIWRDSIPLIAARPLTGYGEDALGLVYGRFLTGDWEPGATFDRVHQGELDLLAGQGLVGFLACTWFFGTWLVPCWRRAWSGTEPAEAVVVSVLAAWAGYLVVVQLNFDWVPATGPLWLLAGVAWAAVREAEAPWPRRAWSRLLAAAPLLAVGISFGVAPVMADASATRGDPAAAARFDPLQAQYHRLLGESRLASTNPAILEGARSELARAIALGAYDTQVFLELGDLDLRLGDHSGARETFRRAVELEPFNTGARARLNAVSSK